jgi:autotransporter-associated beta strand protein
MLTLSGVNTYTGGTAINAGTLAVTTDANLGAASSGLAFGGGALQFLAGFGSNRGRRLVPAAVRSILMATARHWAVRSAALVASQRVAPGR